jgi:hypothetical protein
MTNNKVITFSDLGLPAKSNNSQELIAMVLPHI